MGTTDIEDTALGMQSKGRGNNVATPYDDRGEGITSTHKRGKATTGGNNVDRLQVVSN